MGDVLDSVTLSSRWGALRHNRDYVAEWRAHAGEPALPEAAPFRVRTQTTADLAAARWGLLAWEDPTVGMAASPFWIDAEMPRGRLQEPDDVDPTPLLALLDKAGATLTGLRLLDGALVLMISRGRKAGQVRLVVANAEDAAWRSLAAMMRFERNIPDVVGR